MELFKKCVYILCNGQTDTEKFAALLLVTKSFKSDVLPPSLKQELYEAIGEDFLHRLIHTEQVCEGCPPYIFQSVATSILAVLVSDSDLRVMNFIISEIQFFKQILEKIDRAPEENPLLDDVLFCISVVTSFDESQKKLVQHGLLDSLSCLILHNSYGDGKALQLAIFLINEQPRESWRVSSLSLYSVLTKLASSFCNDESTLKFEKLQVLVTFLTTHPVHVGKPISDQLWVVSLRDAIFELIASKAFKNYNYRDSTLKLASILTEKLGVSWFGLCEDKEVAKKSRKFVALLIHLVTIEIRLVLDDREPGSVVQDAGILLSCYSILECFISVTNDYMWEVIRDFTKQLLESVTEAAASIIQFLFRLSKNWDTEEVIVKDIGLASVRLLCCWMAEETSALRSEIVEILPFILKLAKESAKDPPVNADGCIMRLLLPPLCHLSADNVTRPVLMSENVPALLVHYTQQQWQLLNHSPVEDRLDIIMSTICGVLLNIVVMEGAIVSSEPIFLELFRFLHTSLPQLCSANKFLQLQANFSVLGLLVARLQSSKLKSCEVTFYKFLSSSIMFLWNAHDIVYNNGKASLSLTNDYKAVWSDIAELWFLGLQALSSLLSIVPWIGQFLLNSGWPQHIVSSLHLVLNEDIEGSVKSAYQNFLCCLVKMCPDDVKPLRENGILGVACQHNMKELEHLLHVVDISSCQLIVPSF